MLTAIDIKRRVLLGEGVNTECKKAASELPKTIWETYSAFANTLGGVILLGVVENKRVSDPSRRFTFEGVEKPEKIVSDFCNTINSDKVNVNVVQAQHMSVVEVDGKNIVCIEVPQADCREKPVYLNGNPYKFSFKRGNEGDYHCKEEEVKAMIRDASGDGNDGMLLEGYTMDDIDLESLKSYRNEFRLANQDHPWNLIEDDRVFLKSLGGYAIDRRTGKEGLTVAGLMMFGKGEAVCERFANFRMDYIDKSDTFYERYSYRLTYDGRWENNFYQFFRTVVNRLTIGMRQPFRLENGLRRIDDTAQKEAVREALTNSIIHCDLFMDAGVLRIEKNEEGFVFRNPGVLKVPVEQVYEGGASSARNPRMQRMLRMIGFGENLGSGFPKILHAWKEAGLPRPKIINNQLLNEVELRLLIPRPDNGCARVEEPKWEMELLPPNGRSGDGDGRSEIGQNDAESRSDKEENSTKSGGNRSEYDIKNSKIGQKEFENRSETDFNNSKIGQNRSENGSKIGQKSIEDSVLELLVDNSSITRAELALRLNKAQSTIQRYIEKLKTEGLIERIGGDRGGKWLVKTKE